ncbi:N-6 DNA methylase [Actinoplanes sp. LDG1-06]|uniref:N-6 DNA methylase n=1 Tax=Paractinoplanes ovalisporus TaxID=2810368 RepID=A0ABS2AMJ4_9ACTN|nr:N-6 DNA methylase [Actinoplanes ovalisporus]MBM2621060.1 N-6 DNA methylase [Actinoplanes ovalisporus]
MTGKARVTAADIARFAGVGRAAVSNWRKRYESFPAPVGGTAASPQFDLVEVDRWLAENGKALAIPDEQRFWRDHLESVSDPAEAITMVAEHLSGARPLSDAARRDELDQLVSRTDRGGARETLRQLWLLFADTPARRAAGTPDLLASLMVDLAGVRGGVVLDPACGNGQLLRMAATAGANRVYGQDVDDLTVRLAAAWLALGDVVGEVRGGDSLRADAFPGLTVDAVLGHLPFGQTNWWQDELSYDARWEFGVPPRTEPELAWVQHAFSHLAPSGTAVLLMPPSAAARRAGRRIRAEMLRRGALRAVVALPQGVSTPQAGALHLWILQRNTDAPRPTVLLVDGRALTTADPLDVPEAFDQIRTAIARFLDAGESSDPTFAYVVPAIDVLDDEVDLSPSRRAPIGSEQGNLVREIQAVHRVLRAQTKGLDKRVPELMAAAEGPSLPTLSVAELARAGALEILGPIRGVDGDLIDAPVLTAEDVLRGRAPSGADERLNQRIVLEEGDVVVPLVARHLATRVITEPGRTLAGRNLYVLRPNPEVLNAWFLAGYVGTASNERNMSSLSGTLRLDLKRVQIPRIPIAEQRRHGEAFAQLHQLNQMARQVTDLSAELTRLTVEGLAFGKLRPTEKN